MIAVIWPNFLLLLSITLYSTICAADPFLSAGTPNVDVAYDGKDTTITIYENNEENIKIAIINYDTVHQISIEEGNEALLGLTFVTENDVIYLVVQNVQDYEREDMRSYKAAVLIDIPEFVYIKVLNQDDKAPYFSLDSTSCSVLETDTDHTDCRVTVIDEDGIMDKMEYIVLESGVVSEKLELVTAETQTCTETGTCTDAVIFIKEGLDFLTKPVYSLRIQPKDKGGNLGTVVSYVVQVEAVNKNIPVISPDKLEITIPEGYSGFLPTVATSVTDRDSAEMGQFSIELQDVSAGECFDVFAVVPSGGYLSQNIQISVNNPLKLDYENENCRNINFKIVATEFADSTRFGTADVTVIVTDINDSSPEFEQTDYSFELAEGEHIGSYLGTIIANDADEGDVITYTMSSIRYININSSGDIVSTDVYDYEQQSEIIVTARATDKENHIGYSQITVKVINVNDEMPELRMPQTQPHIKEDVVPPADVGVVITAVDPDDGAELTLRIDWTNSRATKQGAPVDNSLFANCMEIVITSRDSTNVSATLELQQPLNWGTYDTLYLSIEVEDTKTNEIYEENRYTSATLTIYIDDVNNNKPVFGDPGNITVAEETAAGKLIGFITATDADGPGNNNIEFSMTCTGIENTLSNPSDKEYLTINPTTGGIYTTDNLIDFEEFMQFDCNIFASDGIFNSELSITIYVLDENDNWPIFDANIADEYYVNEHEATEQFLGYINASDEDSSPPYKTIYYKSSSQYYTIDPITGRFYLSEGYENDLEYDGTEKFRALEVTITASDNCEDGVCKPGSKSSTRVVTVHLNNLNDNDPVFTTGYSYEITEMTKENENVFPLIATDKDGDGVNFEMSVDEIPCSSDICCSDLFKIEDTGANSAIIKANKALENCLGTYEINITATDNGTNFDPVPRSVSQIYTVNILDENNNAPIISYPQDGTIIRLYREELHENQDITNTDGEIVYIKATDEKDREENGTKGIIYAITGDASALQYFQQPTGKGGSSTIKLLTEEIINTRFELIISATDGTSVLQTSTAKASIIIHLNQDYPPLFNYTTWTVAFHENTTGQSESFTLIPAEDANINDDPTLLEEIYYFIKEDNVAENIFSLEKCDGILMLKEGVMLDREQDESYTFIIFASNDEYGQDINKLNGSSLITVTVTVLDVPDTAPVFENDQVYSAGISLNQKISSIPLLQVSAADPDDDDKLSYTIVHVNGSDSSLQSIIQQREPFILDENTGNLILNFNADDENLKGYFDLIIRATDLVGLWGECPARIYMIANVNLLAFTFGNGRDAVNNARDGIERILTNIIEFDCHIQEVVNTETDGLTNVQTYFVNNENTPVHKDVISAMVNVQETFNELRNSFSTIGLNLKTVEVNAATTETDMESVLQTILIVVSVVLGTLVIVLFAAFFFRTRSLNRRLEALSTTKFGSQESGLNRVGGMAVPNTNKHVLEGSNPIWGNEDVDNREYDNASVSSGDSDLIGVEENPEFNSKSGISNEGFTSDNPAPRRPTGHPMMAPNIDHDFGQNSSASLADLQASTIGRRESVNPLSGKNIAYHNYSNDEESDAGSARDSYTNVGNSNFSFTPTTEL